MNALGHNEAAVRLAALAGDAQIALDRVAKGEADAVAGWLAYGAALNEGRSMFPGDREFGEWLSQWQVAIAVEPHERAAAMWAAANADQLAEAQAASNARTLRGLHAKWKEIEAERQRAAEEAQRKAEAEARAKAEPTEPAAPVSVSVPASGSPADGDGQPPEPGEQGAASGAQLPSADRPEEGAPTPPPADPEPMDPAEAKLRAEFRRMTQQAQEDDWVNLRLTDAEQKARIRKQTAQIADLKAHIKDLEADDKNEVIRRQAATIAHKDRQMFKANEEARRAIAARRRAEDRVKELERAGVAY